MLCAILDDRSYFYATCRVLHTVSADHPSCWTSFGVAIPSQNFSVYVPYARLEVCFDCGPPRDLYLPYITPGCYYTAFLSPGYRHLWCPSFSRQGDGLAHFFPGEP
jgi:hypothetical protein